MYRFRQPIMDRLIQVENENEMPRAEIHKIKRNNDNIYHYGDDNEEDKEGEDDGSSDELSSEEHDDEGSMAMMSL